MMFRRLIAAVLIPSFALLASAGLSQSQTQLFSHAHQSQCRNGGAPIHWRPHLDAASKAYLAPIVVVGQLRQVQLLPIQLNGRSAPLQLQQNSNLDASQQLAYHTQNVNNFGLHIEATFLLSSILKRTKSTPSGAAAAAAAASSLKPGQTIRLLYKVSASLSTTGELLSLVNYHWHEQQAANKTTPAVVRAPDVDQEEACALELTEDDLMKRTNKLFVPQRDYILFLDQSTSPLKLERVQLPSRPAQVAATSHQHHFFHHHNTNQRHLKPIQMQSLEQQPETTLQWAYQVSTFPFAPHENYTNQTIRAVNKSLCKSCVHVPRIEFNSTIISGARASQPTNSTSAGGEAPQPPNRIKLDCLVYGYPTPWIEWFRNGKLLRVNNHNAIGRSNGLKYKIKTTKWKRKQSVRLSRLEIELQMGKNETGIYECRAMNVFAREPVIGAYTLIVWPNRYFVVPMQQVGVASSPVSVPDASPNVYHVEAENKISTVSSQHEQHQANNILDNNVLAERHNDKNESSHRRKPVMVLPPPLIDTAKGSSVHFTPTMPSKTQSNSDGNRNDGTAHRSPQAIGLMDKLTPTLTNSISTTTLSFTTTTPTPDGHYHHHNHHHHQSAPTPHKDNGGTNSNAPMKPAVITQKPSSVVATDSTTNRNNEDKQSTSPALTSNSKSRPSNPTNSKSHLVGQPCPREAHDNLCFNKGTCVLIGHIEEYFCNCAEGYHGHRCEYKSLGHQQIAH